MELDEEGDVRAVEVAREVWRTVVRDLEVNTRFCPGCWFVISTFSILWGAQSQGSRAQERGASGEPNKSRTEFWPPNGLATEAFADGSGIHSPSTTRQY